MVYHKCIGCHIEKPLDKEFFREANNSRGYYARCRVCINKKRNDNKKNQKENVTYIKVDEITCTTCKQTKEANKDNFHRNKHSLNGYASQCKACANERKRKQREKIRKNQEYLNIKEMECNSCHVTKPLNTKHFYKDRGDITGHNRTCIKCNQERLKKTPRKIINEEEYLELDEFKCTGCNITKPLNLDFFHMRSDSITRYNQRCKECHNESRKETSKAASQRRRALKNELPSNFTVEDWEYTLSYFDNQCAYCNHKNVPLEQEHIIPVAKGGGYIPENIIPACSSCNSSKNARDLNCWYPSQKIYKEENMDTIQNYIFIIKKESMVSK